MLPYLKKFEKIASIILLIVGLSVPLLLFLNRFLIPDISADSLNYHYYLGFKGWNGVNNQFEFFTTGIHNFSPVLDMFGYAFSMVLGYRLGSIFSIVAIYLAILGLYKIFKLLLPSQRLLDDIGATFLFVSSFLSFELFLGIASYYVDGLVAMFSVWCAFFLIKYFDRRQLHDLFWSALILSFLVLGKQTNLYLAVCYFLTLMVFLIFKKTKLINAFWLLAVVGFVVMFLPFFWYLNNYLLTGNPVFPFYNAIFKSRFFDPVSFIETQFGGANLWQRTMWWYYSILDPPRLGQVHDLFNDFKLNLYVIVVFGFILLKKAKGLIGYLVLFFMSGYLFWALQFGYLRYGLMLEFLGGLLVLIYYCQIKSGYRYLIFLPLFVWLVVVNKRIVNLSLAYDIGFRQTYFYNRESYPKELKNWNVRAIETDQKIIEFKPDIYLNCAMGVLTYYPLSPFSNLPVVNINDGPYLPMTSNTNYNNEINLKLKPYLADKKIVKFVAIAAVTGMNTESVRCSETIKNKNWQIDGTSRTSFLGYDWQGLNIIYGEIDGGYFGNIK